MCARYQLAWRLFAQHHLARTYLQAIRGVGLAAGQHAHLHRLALRQARVLQIGLQREA